MKRLSVQLGESDYRLLAQYVVACRTENGGRFTEAQRERMCGSMLMLGLMQTLDAVKDFVPVLKACKEAGISGQAVREYVAWASQPGRRVDQLTGDALRVAHLVAAGVPDVEECPFTPNG